MEKKNSIMDYEPILPEDFDGHFRFTNFSDEDFVGIWNGKEYHFPANKTVKMVMTDYSPLEIQHIRKKFAKNLAEREFFRGKKYEQFRLREGEKDEMGMIKPRGYGMSHAGQYTLEDLTPYIQACLQPKEESKLTSKEIPKEPLENKLSRNDDGELNTKAIDKKESLREKAKLG